MSKTKLLLDAVSDMRSLADSLEALANAMCDLRTADEVSVSPKPDTEPPRMETNSQPQLSLEEVRGVLAEKSANGHSAKIRALLKKYGHTKLSEIDPKDYPALLADAEVLGNGKE